MPASVEEVRRLLVSRLNIGGTVDQYGGQPVPEESVTEEINKQYGNVNSELSTIYVYPIDDHPIVANIVNNLAAGFILHANHQNDLEQSPEGEYATVLIREGKELLAKLMSKKILLDGETLKTPLTTSASLFGTTFVSNPKRNNPWALTSEQKT